VNRSDQLIPMHWFGEVCGGFQSSRAVNGFLVDLARQEDHRDTETLP